MSIEAAPTVLVVDDDGDCRGLVKSVLPDLFGIRVICAESGDQALEWLLWGLKPNAVMLDLLMRPVSGDEVIRIIRDWESQLKPTPRMPLIVFSALDSAHHRDLFPLIDDYIDKPFDLDNLVERIHRAIRRQRSS